MIVAKALAVLAGTALTLSVLLSALETVVLPRKSFTRIARTVFALSNRLLVHGWHRPSRAARLRGLYAPIALVSLPLVWMLAVAGGFTLIFWGIGAGTLSHSFELSGSSLTTLGFSKPAGAARVWLTFTEAIIGLGLVALLIGYLPTIYSSHAERERGITVLRPFAGTPPSAVNLLLLLHQSGELDNPEMWRTATQWLLNLDQSHTAYPALTYFPDSEIGSWVASIGTLLDAGSLVRSASSHLRDRDARLLKGPMMALVYGIPTLEHIARAVGLPVPPPMRPAELLVASGPPPDQSVRRPEYEQALAKLGQVLEVPDEDVDACWARFCRLRSGYDLALRGLAGLTLAPSAPWTTDRPAAVGRPRLLSGRPLGVDWQSRGVGDGHDRLELDQR